MDTGTIYLSESADSRLMEYCRIKGYSVKVVSGPADNPIGDHPDLYYCSLGEYVFHGDKSLVGHAYPEDSIYNAASTGRFFIHNTSITHPDLLKAAEDLGQTVIHVRQGYCKCSCCIVDESSILTSDGGIAKGCEGYLDVCLISPGYVELKNYKYGFIGGASGKIDDEIVFNGNLPEHPDYEKIRSFIEERGLNVKFFEEYPLTDIGSIIVE